MPSSETSRIHTVMGRRVRMHDSLADFLLVRDCLQDELLEDTERFDVLLYLLFEDPQGVCDALGAQVLDFVVEALWDAFGIDLHGAHETDDRRLLDWEEDHDRIVVTCRAAYGIDYETFEGLSYKECCLLVGLAPHETPMGQAIYYRTAKPPRRNKYNGDEVDAFRKAQAAYRLGQAKSGDPEQAMRKANDAATASFMALAALAKRAGDDDG